MKFNNKVAIVTGSARGIGRSIALNLAKDGCDIVVCDINLEGWKEYGGEELTALSVAEEVRNLGRRALEVVVNVTQKESVENLVKQTLDYFGKVDFMVNNAGGYAGNVVNSWAATAPEEDIRATVERNLYGTIFSCQAAAKYMINQKYGKIVNFGSQAGLRAQDGGYYAAYGAAKAGVIMYTKYLAQQMGQYNVNVNCIAPAYVGTKRLNYLIFDNNREEVCKGIPLGKIAEPNDIAKVVNFLVSDDADYITGQCISVCGGAINF